MNLLSTHNIEDSEHSALFKSQWYCWTRIQHYSMRYREQQTLHPQLICWSLRLAHNDKIYLVVMEMPISDLNFWRYAYSAHQVLFSPLPPPSFCTALGNRLAIHVQYIQDALVLLLYIKDLKLIWTYSMAHEYQTLKGTLREPDRFRFVWLYFPYFPFQIHIETAHVIADTLHEYSL